MARPRILALRLADLLADAAAILAAVIMALLCALILLEIGLRFFDSSTYMVEELGGYAIAALTFLAMGHTFRRGEMIRVQVLLSSLGPRTRRIVEILCAVLALAGFGLVTWYLGSNALRTWERGAMGTGIIEIPQWIPAAVVFCGAFLLCLQILCYALDLLINADAELYESNTAIE